MKNIFLNRLQLAIISCMVIFIAVQWLRINKLEADVAKAEDKAAYYKYQSEDMTKMFKDEQDLWRATNNVLAISNRSLLSLKREKDPRIEELYDEFKKANKHNVESFSKTSTRNRTPIIVPLHDTIYKGDTAKVIKYKDKFFSLDGIISGDTLKGKAEYIDNLDGIIYKERKKFLFIRYGKTTYSSEMVSKNPNTQITMNSIVMIKKSKDRR